MNFNWFFKYRERIFRVLICLFIISLPLGFAFNTALLYVLVLLFFLDKKDNLNIKIHFVLNSRLVLLYFLMFAVQIIGLIHTENLDMGLSKVMVFLPFVFLPAFMVGEGSIYDVGKVFSVLKVSIPLIFIGIVVMYVFSNNYDGIDRIAQLWFVDKIGISQFYLVFILLLPVFFCIKDLSKKNVFFNSAIVSICAFLLMLMNNITGLVFLLFSILLFFRGIYFKTSKLYLVVALSALSIIIATFAYINSKIEKKLQPLLTTSVSMDQIKVKNKYGYTKNTLEHRMYIHYLALSNSKDFFPFGIGTGDSQDYLNKVYTENSFLSGIRNKLNAHSQFLQEFIKTGIVGLGVLIILFIYLLLACRNKGSIFFTYVLFFVLACFFESYLNRYHGVIICCGIIPLLLQHKNILSKYRDELTKR